MVPDLSPVSSSVWPSSEHAFVADDAHGEIVDSYSMRLSAHDLRCHVTRRSRCVLGVVRVPNSRNTQIGNFEIAILVEDQILRLDIPV